MSTVRVSNWEKFYVCSKCKTEISWSQKMDNHGTCTHCGNTNYGSVVSTHEGSKRFHYTVYYNWFVRLVTLFQLKSKGYWEYRDHLGYPIKNLQEMTH